MSDSHDDQTDTGLPIGAASGSGEHEGFLGRWSRRKTQAQHASQAAEPGTADSRTTPAADASRPDDERDPEPSVRDENSHEVPVTAPELPPLQSLDENADYSAFLTPGVSVTLKKKALRQLFHSPKFNIRDGLDDYDLDYRSFVPLGDVLTAEMRYRMLRGLEKLADLAPDDSDDVPTATPSEWHASNETSAKSSNDDPLTDGDTHDDGADSA